MGGETFENVHVVVADPDAKARAQVRATLLEAGFKNIEEGDSFEFLEDRLQNSKPELLISETKFSRGNFSQFITDLRHNKFGHNPFLTISALTGNPTAELAKEVITAGADDLLVKPVSKEKLLERVGRLVHSRKPFVVTSDYVGPVRPAQSQKENDAEKFEAPNTLKSKATGEGSDDDVQKMVDQAINSVNTRKLESHAEHIDELIGMVLPRLQEDEFDATTKLCLDRLVFVAEDSGRRLGGSKYDHVSELCHSLLKVSASIRNCGGAPAAKDVSLLTPLNQAIQLGFQKGADEASARRISQAVGR